MSFTFSATGADNAQRLQKETREWRRFAENEASLPGSESKSLVATAGRLLRNAAGFIEYLRGGPRPQPLTSDDSVWLLDNVAFATQTGTGTGTGTGTDKDTSYEYTAEYVVAVLSKKPTLSVVDAVRDVARKLGLDDGNGDGGDNDAALKTIEERITPFLQEIRPGRVVHALHGADWPLKFSPGDRNGLSSDLCQLPASHPGALVPTTAVNVPHGTEGQLAMTTLFSAPGTGWGVISDIDDTIKRTQTSDPIGILQTTFVDEPTPIAGMPALYQHLQAAMGGPGSGAPFFYLSASPYNLYPFLRDFRDAHYPTGALVLRDAALTSVSGLLATLTQGTQAYKEERMQKIQKWLPEKQFVCIGDSTQSDPEAYGALYRAHAATGWIGLILIRKVTDIAALGMAAKNAPARFEAAFAGVPRDKWHVFEDPAECYEWVDRAMAGGGGGGDSSARRSSV